MTAVEYVSGKLIGGGLCEGCGRRIREGERVYTPKRDVEKKERYLYCPECRPSEEDLPGEVLCLQPARAVRETTEDSGLSLEVKAGSACRKCGRVFVEGDWLFVGVVEGLHHGFIYCSECYRSLREEEGNERNA